MTILGKKEAEATVRKDKKNRYFDLSTKVLTRKGIRRLKTSQLMELFKKLRLRISLTPQCNLFCFFCSNEGLSYSAKRDLPADIDLVIDLCEMLLKTTPLKSIDFSGGEPTLHPDFLSKEFRIIKFTKRYPHVRFSLHSNGINLSPEIIDQIKNHFSRIGITVNSLNFKKWNRITNAFNQFPESVQKKKFNQMIKNIQYLGKQNIGYKVFIKSVIMRGINDSEKDLKELMDFCADYHFHPKLLQFEPQHPSQAKYEVGRAELFSKLERIGCIFSPDVPFHNNPKTYIPGVNFQYLGKPGAEPGLHSIFGCGDEGACLACYDFLCMFVKSHSNIKGLYLKPCSVLDTRIDLTHAIRTKNHKQLIELFRVSREYLMLAPGLGTKSWNKEESYFTKEACF